MGKKEGYLTQTYADSSYKVIFKEDEDAYFYAFEDGDDVYCPLDIVVYEKRESTERLVELSRYYNQWDNEVSRNTVNSFIKNFLENPEYRTEYFKEGEHFEGIIKYASKNGINKKCEEAIKKFNKKPKDKRKFIDYAGLKTYGIDKFSRIKLSEIELIISTEDINKVKEYFGEDDTLVLKSLRWVCRGLSAEDAIRKIKSDLEIANNIKK